MLCITNRFIALLSVILIAGCTTLPTSEQIDDADYGHYPTDYELIVKAYYNKTRTDADSVQFNAIHKPVRYWLGNELDGNYFGYLICATVNTKNRLGRYTGFRYDAFLVNNDNVLKYVKGGEWWGETLCPPPDAN